MGRRSNDELWAAHQPPKKRGEGSVFWVNAKGNKPGFWRATKTVQWDPINKKTTQVTGSGATPTEAINRRDANYTKALVRVGKLRKSQLPISAKDTRQTFEVLLWEWFKWKKDLRSDNRSIRPSTQDQYESLINLHIAPSPLGQMPLRLIERKHVREFLFEYLPGLTREAYRLDSNGNRVGRETVERLGTSNKRAIHGIVSMAFKFAQMEREYIENNPADGIRPIPKESYKSAAESNDNFKWVAKNLALHLKGDPQELRWILAMTTGGRQMELLSLTWDRIKYIHEKQTDTPRILISHQLRKVDVQGKKSWILEKQVKSESSHRIVPIDPRVVEIIRSYREIQNKWKREEKWDPIEGLEDLVFTTKTGRPISPTRDNKRFRELLRKYELPYIRQHSLRHFAASAMVANGANLNAVSAILGHGSVSITRAVYVHDEIRPMIAPIKGLVDTMFRDRERGEIVEWDENGPVETGPSTTI